eukprot:CAMPEP_0198308148 /NCGR_PEP_ID=MMETSP1450-20131203/904_1 /TAXON_ID=753684 ORGANISM="Madagascaria erythrocladiodes, Strain CCMP3234" /NCGR_SAMPLE_ID=MMETSP1450 /ASSEMBLY_ACC=CAM_ASM_001115 /LENGTH=234 /DNA_ID=CAMNT_0044010789 /DNA_START=76 /DNA_END=780 /DNA_ORIENTATION=-
MNEADVRRQLENMVAFIHQEAEEKATEIMAKAKDDHQLEKDRLVEAGKEKITKDYDAKEKQVEVRRKIEFSNRMNKCRVRYLDAREKAIQAVLAEALERQVAAVAADAGRYAELLYKLVLQALLKVREAEVTVVCRAEDVALVEKAAPRAAAEYTRVTGNACTATISKKFFLAPGRKDAAQAQFCSGGVLITAHKGRIVCSNTLDDRLSLAYQQQIPLIRKMLLGANPNRKHDD